MKIIKVLLSSGLVMTFLLTGCRSRQEASGDNYRKKGDALHALMQYEEALKRGPVSKEFPKNYTLVNIQAMALRAQEDPMAEFLDILTDTVASLLNQHPDPANQTLFVKTLEEIGAARIKLSSSEAIEGGFRLLNVAQKLGSNPQTTAAMQSQVLASKLKEIEGDFQDAATTPTAGIVADYKMNKLMLMVGSETAEMKPLWSSIRKLNLNTYLMYDNDEVDLGERPDARINKYGPLLGIVKSEVSATSAKIQLKIFNGSSGPIVFDSPLFTLVDRAGNVYKPTAKIGNFNAKTEIGKGDESKTGGLTFSFPDGTEPYYIDYNNGVSRKYLP